MVTTVDRRHASRTWSDKMCIQLIKEYRDRPILWDPKDASYYKREHKQNAWESISGALGMQPWECKHKMGILLSSFRREKCKQLKAGNSTDSRWFAYQHLKFLMVKDGDKEQNLAPSDESDDTGSDKSGDSMDGCDEKPSHFMQAEVEDDGRVETEILITEDLIKKEQFTTNTDTDNEDVNPLTETESNPRNRKSHVTDRKFLERDGTPDSSGKRRKLNYELSQFHEELDTFVKFVHTKMKKYSQAQVYHIQRDICAILFKADQELSETNPSK